MPDFDAMRGAMNRALGFTEDAFAQDTTDFTHFCSSCKVDYLDNSGTKMNVSVVDREYHLWYCDNCFGTPVDNKHFVLL